MNGSPRAHPCLRWGGRCRSSFGDSASASLLVAVMAREGCGEQSCRRHHRQKDGSSASQRLVDQPLLGVMQQALVLVTHPP